ncbi:MAG: putative bifunctional diguanylate cyclase/phosphodiesterase [Nitrospiraceae bacterium]
MSEKPIIVLLVEDNPGDSNLIREMLAQVRGTALAIECADGLATGLELLAAGSHDVVLLDVTRPDSHGRDALAQLRAQAPRSPIIVLTDRDDEAVAVKAVREGAEDCLVKGQINSNLLVRAIRYAIARKRSEEAVQAAKEYAENLINSSLDMIISVDTNRNIVEFNGAAEQVFGYSKAEVLGKSIDLLYADPSEGRKLHKDSVGGGFTGEVANKKKNGEIFTSYVSATIMHDTSGSVVGVMGISRDITERKQAEETIVHQAYHDALTNLANRRLFMERLALALTRVPWHKRLVGVLFLDLDHFKSINDALGHSVGDRLLQAVAERLTACVREGDTVARLGGDEFAIALADVARANDVPKVAQKIIEALSKPYVLEGREFFTTTSIGISISPDDAQDPESLVKNADIAMYRAKKLGRNNYQHYSPDMNAQAFERLAIETSLRHALEREEFFLEYQPQFDIGTGRLIGYEALVRWRHRDLGMISPGKFIPLAEESGLIVPIGEWVLRTACAQNKAWQAAGLPPIRVAVNVSPRQLRQDNLLPLVERILRETGLHPTHLELELTESSIQDSEEAIQLFSQLQSMGVQIAIDDFGTGYSSLNHLKRYSIDKLKIDQSFVRDIAHDPHDRAIVKAIIALAHSLSMNAVAEGVETEAQMAYLRSLKCDEAQGYLLGRPMSAQDASQLLTGRSAQVAPDVVPLTP